MQISGIYAACSSLCQTNGYLQALDEFSFSHQPSGNLDACFRIHSERTQTIGELNRLSQIEVHRVEIWLARRLGFDPVRIRSEITDALDALEAALIRGDAGEDFTVIDEEVESAVQLPEVEDGPVDYYVGRLAFNVDFDRSLV